MKIGHPILQIVAARRLLGQSAELLEAHVTFFHQDTQADAEPPTVPQAVKEPEPPAGERTARPKLRPRAGQGAWPPEKGEGGQGPR